MLRVKIWTASLAISGAIFYLLCIVGRLVAPATGYHETFLEVALPGFEWLTPLGFVAASSGAWSMEQSWDGSSPTSTT